MATRSNRSASRTRDSARRRGRLAPGKTARGLEASEVAIAMDDPAIAELVALVKGAGGAPIGAYHEPLGGRALLLASVPLGAVQPTPFQRTPSASQRRSTRPRHFSIR